MSTEPIRVQMSTEEAAIIVSAIRYWRDTFLAEDHDEEEYEATELWIRSERIEARVHRAMRRRGVTIEADS